MVNTFILSWDVSQCARWTCNKHVVKMPLEQVQLLYTAHAANNGLKNRGWRSLAPNVFTATILLL